MSDFCSKLNHAGIVARDELLDLLGFQRKGNGDFTVNDIKDRIFPTTIDPATKSEVKDLDRAVTLAAIMRGSPKSIKLAEAIKTDKLKRFFTKLIEEISNVYHNQCRGDGKITDPDLINELKRDYLISDPELRAYLSAYRQCNEQEKDNWFPSNLCDESPCPPKKYTKSSNSNVRESFQSNIVELLYDLDYDNDRQERYFYDTLNEQNTCISFSIVAPCAFTQKWILNRLITKAVDLTSNRKFNAADRPSYSVNLESQIRNDYIGFLTDISRHFNSEPDKIVQEICQIDTELPLILTIRGAKKFHPIRQRILNEFWRDIQTGFSFNSGQTKIIMFWIDDDFPFIPSDCLENVVLLDRLDKIDKTDVQRWVARNRKAFSFSENLINNKYPYPEWYWSDPKGIVDKICNELSSNLIADLENLWKWTL